MKLIMKQIDELATTFAKGLLRDGNLSPEAIADRYGLEVEQVRGLAANLLTIPDGGRDEHTDFQLVMGGFILGAWMAETAWERME